MAKKNPRISKALAALLGLSVASGCTGATALYGVALTDDDGDGYYDGEDCNDADDTIHPGADDTVGDGIDQNCDGVDGIASNDTGE